MDFVYFGSSTVFPYYKRLLKLQYYLELHLYLLREKYLPINPHKPSSKRALLASSFFV